MSASIDPALFTTTGHESQAAERIALERSRKQSAGYKDRALSDFLRAGLLHVLREIEWRMDDARTLVREKRTDTAIALLVDAQAELADAIALAHDYIKEESD